jgi:hypothetical protein
MKKFTIITLISVLLTFTAAMALAHDDHNKFKNFHGTYEMSASGSCIHSEKDFTIGTDGWYYANPGGVIYAGTTAWSGTWTFKNGGKGTYSYVEYATVTPPVQQPDPPILGGIRIFSGNELNFTYEITPFGDITVKVTENGQVDTLSGSISADKKTMTLFDALRIKGPPPTSPYWNPYYKFICTATRTLIKISD